MNIQTKTARVIVALVCEGLFMSHSAYWILSHRSERTSENFEQDSYLKGGILELVNDSGPVHGSEGN